MRPSFQMKAAAGAFGAALAVFLTVSGLSYWSTARLVDAADWRQQTQKVIAEITALQAQLADAETGARGYVITGDDRFLQPYDEAALRVPERLRALRQLIVDGPDQSLRLDEVEPVVRAKFQSLADTIALRRSTGLAEAANTMRAARGQSLMGEIRLRLASMEEEEQRLLVERERAVNDRAARTNFSFLTGAFVSVGLLVAAFLALDREVRSRRQAEEALRRQTSILRSILDSIADGVVVADEKGHFLLYNPAAERMVGLGAMESPPGEWSARYGVFRPDGVTPFPSEELPLARAMRGETVCDVEAFIRNPAVPDGVLILHTAAPLWGEGGALRGGVVVTHDITRRKRDEQALRDAKEAAEAANRELEAFSYSVSHDLRAPLRAIDGFSQALLEDYADRLGPEGRDSLDRVRRGAQRMAQLIDDLLDLSRIARAELALQPVDLSALVREIAQDLGEADPAHPVRVAIEEGVTAVGDPRLLRVALENLLANAWKFTRGRKEASIEFRARAENGGPVYCVRDNGAGFDMTYADKLFGAFQRLHSEADFEGTGIGLATVARVVRRHGGEVWAEGSPDRGAAFFFTLGGPEPEAGEA